MNQATQSANYYQVLGASPMDTLDKIEDLFRQLAYEAERSGDHSRIPQIVEAFKVLRDPSTREQYNQSIRVSSPNDAPQRMAAPAPEPQQQPAPQQHAPEPQQSVHQQPAPQQHAPEPEALPPVNYPAVSAPVPQPPAETARIIQDSAPLPPTAPQPVAELAAPVEAVPAVQPAEELSDAAGVRPAMAEEGTNLYCAATGARRRRELLAMFYQRRRELPRDSGLAIGGLDQKVDYEYDELEFHLWYMLEKEWLFREESGMLSINYKGVEQHESNQLEGLI